MGVVAIKELDYVVNIRIVQEESEMLKTKEYLISMILTINISIAWLWLQAVEM